jgi:hypothetical protein
MSVLALLMIRVRLARVEMIEDRINAVVQFNEAPMQFRCIALSSVSSRRL